MKRQLVVLTGPKRRKHTPWGRIAQERTRVGQEAKENVGKTTMWVRVANTSR